MFISADTMTYLFSLGLGPDELTELVRRLDDDAKSVTPIRTVVENNIDTAAERKRTADRERMRSKREAETVARQSRDVACDISDNSLSRPLSPQTPQTPTHTHGDINTHARKADREPDGFAAFWEVYPRRVGRGAAVKSYRSAVARGATPPSLRLAVERDKRSQWAGRSTEMIPHAATWLNQDRWLDEPPEPQEQQSHLRSANDRPTRQSVQLTERYENYQRALSGAEVAAQHRAVEPSGGF